MLRPVTTAELEAARPLVVAQVQLTVAVVTEFQESVKVFNSVVQVGPLTHHARTKCSSTDARTPCTSRAGLRWSAFTHPRSPLPAPRGPGSLGYYVILSRANAK